MKHRIAAVSYVNTLPFIAGLESPEIKDEVEVVLAHPARCAELLERGEVDIALCPIGALPALKKYHVITDYCIGCDGPVRTVSIYSHQPFNEVEQVVLFAESRTSNVLVQILNREFWKYPIRFTSNSSISSTFSISSSFLFIGDLCFQKEKEFAYRTDLGQAWKEYSGLPFAFACWVSREVIEPAFIDKLNKVFAQGIASIDRLSFGQGMDEDVMKDYLRKNISYPLDAGKKEAMRLFFELGRNVEGF